MKRERKISLLSISHKKAILNELHVLSSVIANRAELSNTLGQSFGGRRDLYRECGYPLSLSYQDYFNRYTRQDIAHRIIWAPVLATWRKPPEIRDDDKPDINTPFEKEWLKLVKQLSIFCYLSRVDALAGLGRYSVLHLGINENKLIYLRPYSEENAKINSWELNINSSRYGLPKNYNINIGTPEDINMYTDNSNLRNTRTILIDQNELIHIADGLLEDDVFGEPRLKVVYNRLQDVETILAGSAEMFWQGAFPGMAFEMDAEANPDTQTLADIDDQIVTFIHHLRRTLRLQGVKTNQLKPQVASPTAHLTAQIKIISGATGIPTRILTGSERGELASSQDEKNWNSRVDERRATYAEYIIVRPFVDRLIEYNVLPSPKNNEYEVIWHDITAMSEEDEAQITKLRMEALSLYSNALEARDIYPINSFLKNELGLSNSEIKGIVKSYEKRIKKIKESVDAATDRQQE